MTTKVTMQAVTTLCAALVISLPSYAQSPAAAPESGPAASRSVPLFKMTEDNLKATAMAGAFFNAMQGASRYRGRFVATKKVVKDGKAVREKVLNWQSTWIGDGDGTFTKCVAQGRLTTTEGEGASAKTTVLEVVQADGGDVRRTFYPAKNEWSVKDQPFGDEDMSVGMSRLLWTIMLTAFDRGEEYRISRLVSGAEPERTLITNEKNTFKLILDTASGHVRSLSLGSGDGENIELRWEELELNGNIPQSALQWTPPADARQVPPGSATVRFQF